MRFTTYIEIPVTVEFDYQPREKQTLTYPGCHEDAEVTSVMFSGVDISSGLGKVAVEQLRLEALDHVQTTHEGAA